jgi:hypothetical protein
MVYRGALKSIDSRFIKSVASLGRSEQSAHYFRTASWERIEGSRIFFIVIRLYLKLQA